MQGVEEMCEVKTEPKPKWWRSEAFVTPELEKWLQKGITGTTVLYAEGCTTHCGRSRILSPLVSSRSRGQSAPSTASEFLFDLEIRINSTKQNFFLFFFQTINCQQKNKIVSSAGDKSSFSITILFYFRLTMAFMTQMLNQLTPNVTNIIIITAHFIFRLILNNKPSINRRTNSHFCFKWYH